MAARPLGASSASSAARHATPYYPALTGVRALAAFAVFAFHYGSYGPPPGSAGGAVARLVAGELNSGVSVFFTLSGYLLAARYAGQPLGPAGWRRYLLHRAARILPVYWALAFLSIGLHCLKPAAHPLWGPWWLYLVNLTLVKGLVARWYLTGLPQSWSLTVEEGFYLLAPLLFWLGRRYGVRRAWPLAGLGLLGTGLAVYGVVPALGGEAFMLKATFFGRSAEFLLGAAFARLGPPRWLRGRATAAGGVGLVLVFGLLLGLHAASRQNTLDLLPGLLCHTWLLPVATGCLLAGLAAEATWLSRVLSTKPWQRLGRASYCFYLLHLGVVPDTVASRLGPWLPAGAVVGATLLAVVLAALLLHRYFEQPVYRWLVFRLAPAARPASSAPRG